MLGCGGGSLQDDNSQAGDQTAVRGSLIWTVTLSGEKTAARPRTTWLPPLPQTPRGILHNGERYIGSEHGWKYPDGSDVILIKVDSNGTELWRKQLELPDEMRMPKELPSIKPAHTWRRRSLLMALSARRNGLSDLRNPTLCSSNTTVAELIWSNQFRTAAEEDLSGIAADGLGLVYLTGNVRHGGSNVFLSCYGLDGQQAWEKSVQLELESAEGEKHPGTGSVQGIAIVQILPTT